MGNIILLLGLLNSGSKMIQTDTPQVDQIEQHQEAKYEGPKIKTGMSQDALFQALGHPWHKEFAIGGGEQLLYKGHMCETEDSSCYVIIQDGVIASLAEFNQNYL
jgi:hypothetical protein